MNEPQRDKLAVLGVGLVAFAFYAALAPTALCGADNAEFVTLMTEPGVAHPPGYPIYTLYLRAMAWLPGATAAHTAAIATAILGASAIAAIVAGAMRWGASRSVAALAGLLVATELHVLAVHNHAEVFALNNLIAALIVLVAAPRSGHPTRRAGILGLLAGIGLANHHSIVLLAPLGLWAVYGAVRAAASWPRAIAAAIAGGLIGLLPYLVLFAAPDDCAACLSWGEFERIADIGHHFLRGDYGTTSLAAKGERAPLTHLIAFAQAIARGSFIAVPVLALLGLARMWRDDRGLAGVWGATLLLCGPVFIALFNLSADGIGAEIVARFYALPILMCTPLVAAAARAAPRPAKWLLAAFAIACSMVNGADVSKRCTGVIDHYVVDNLAPLPPDAILFGTGDHRSFGISYMQQVEHVRPDVDWVDGMLLAHSWYADRVERRLKVDLPRSTATGIPILEFVLAAQQTGRPVFATHIFAEALTALPSYPIGPTIRLLPPGGRPPPPRVLAAQNAELFETLRLQQPLSSVESAWEREVYPSYARPWNSIAATLDQIGDPVGAAQARKMAAVYEE